MSISINAKPVGIQSSLKRKQEETVWKNRLVMIAGGILALSAIGVAAFLYAKTKKFEPTKLNIFEEAIKKIPKIEIDVSDDGSFHQSVKKIIMAVKKDNNLTNPFALTQGVFSKIIHSSQYDTVPELQGSCPTPDFVFENILDLMVGTQNFSKLRTANQNHYLDKICKIFHNTCGELVKSDVFNKLKPAPDGVNRNAPEFVRQSNRFVNALFVQEYKFLKNRCFSLHPQRDTILSALETVGNYVLNPIVSNGIATDRGSHHLTTWVKEMSDLLSLAKVVTGSGSAKGIRFYRNGNSFKLMNPCDYLFRTLYMKDNNNTFDSTSKSNHANWLLGYSDTSIFDTVKPPITKKEYYSEPLPALLGK